jgi:hypothetical protein
VLIPVNCVEIAVSGGSYLLVRAALPRILHLLRVPRGSYFFVFAAFCGNRSCLKRLFAISSKTGPSWSAWFAAIKPRNKKPAHDRSKESSCRLVFVCELDALDHFINESVFGRFRSAHEIVAVCIFFDALECLSGTLC